MPPLPPSLLPLPRLLHVCALICALHLCPVAAAGHSLRALSSVPCEVALEISGVRHELGGWRDGALGLRRRREMQGESAGLRLSGLGKMAEWLGRMAEWLGRMGFRV